MEDDMDLPDEEKTCDVSPCLHAAMISDPQLIKVVFEILDSEQQADPGVFERINKMDNKQLEKEIAECTHLQSSIFETHKGAQDLQEKEI